MSLGGWGYCYLAGAIEDDRWTHSPLTIEARRTAKVAGPVSSFLEKGDEKLFRQMSNFVRVCARCSKSCGKTLSSCNNCANDISNTPITRTNNALMAFVYGLEPFPTSIRYEDEFFLVYDDLMQTTLIHLNSIPTDTYIPDFRFLFSDPSRGIEIIDSLFEKATKAATEMLKVEGFCRKFFSSNALEILHAMGPDKFIRRFVFSGFNYPPSQCQLHLQFILPPYVPYHAVLLAEGKHSDKDRFFTYDFLRSCLLIMMDRNIRFSMRDIDSLIGKELVEYLQHRLGVDYYKSYHESLARHRDNDKFLSNWTHKDFKYVVVDKRIVFPVQVLEGDQFVPLDMKPAEIQARDKDAITSYGKGAGLQYYSFAKETGQVEDWPDT